MNLQLTSALLKNTKVVLIELDGYLPPKVIAEIFQATRNISSVTTLILQGINIYHLADDLAIAINLYKPQFKIPELS